ncbi:MAG: glycosyltransferase family 2 protein [Nitrospirales bacterium]
MNKNNTVDLRNFMQAETDKGSISLPNILVIIVNWERAKDTIECLESIPSASNYHLRILVVDNGSKDDSVALISQEFPYIDLLRLPQNSGFTGGYNAGIQWGLATNASHFFLLNNDTVVDTQVIEALLDTPWDVAVPKIYYYAPSELIWAAGSRWRAFPPSIIMRGRGKPDSPHYDQPIGLDYATGCVLLVKREVMECLGGFDPIFENYMEDYDFCYTLRQHGFSLGYQPKAHVWHKESKTLGFQSHRRWHYLGRNTVIFYRKKNRFKRSLLWSVLIWFSIRETINGRLLRLPHFWKGVLEGRRLIDASQLVESCETSISRS